MPQANRRPRKCYMASRDLGKRNEGQETTGGTIVFASGPYERKRFASLAKAQNWLDEWLDECNGPPEWGTIYELVWRPIEPNN